MTDNEIIKALECCIAGQCADCPLKAGFCNEQVAMAHAVDLINRQKVENERLQEECFIKSQKRANIFEISESFERGRIKGIKEFAEMIKIENRNELGYIVLEDEDVDDIVKEFIGDNNAE